MRTYNLPSFFRVFSVITYNPYFGGVKPSFVHGFWGPSVVSNPFLLLLLLLLLFVVVVVVAFFHPKTW